MGFTIREDTRSQDYSSYGSFQQLGAPLRKVCGCRDVWSLGYIGYGVQGFQKKRGRRFWCAPLRIMLRWFYIGPPCYGALTISSVNFRIPYFVRLQAGNPHTSGDA